MPKGVGATHENLAFGCRLAPARRDFDHSEHFIHAFPIGTNASQMMLHNAIVAHPAALVLGRFDPELFCAAIAEHAVGTAFIVPAMAVELLASKAFERHDLSSVVMVSPSGSARDHGHDHALRMLDVRRTVPHEGAAWTETGWTAASWPE